MAKKQSKPDIDKVHKAPANAPSFQDSSREITEKPGAYDFLLLKKWGNGSPATGRDLARLIRLEYIIENPDGTYRPARGLDKFIPSLGVKHGNTDPDAEVQLAPGVGESRRVLDKSETQTGASAED